MPKAIEGDKQTSGRDNMSNGVVGINGAMDSMWRSGPKMGTSSHKQPIAMVVAF